LWTLLHCKSGDVELIAGFQLLAVDLSIRLAVELNIWLIVWLVIGLNVWLNVGLLNVGLLIVWLVIGLAELVGELFDVSSYWQCWTQAIACFQVMQY